MRFQLVPAQLAGVTPYRNQINCLRPTPQHPYGPQEVYFNFLVTLFQQVPFV